jgi:hypothetical protein
VLLDAVGAIKTEIPYRSHLRDHSRVQRDKLFPQMGTIVVQLDNNTTRMKLVAYQAAQVPLPHPHQVPLPHPHQAFLKPINGGL